MRTKTLNTENGFTLLEALVAMVILTVGIMTFYSMQITAIKGNGTANRLTLSSSLAADSFERLLQVGYTDATMDAATNPHDESEFAGLVLPAPVTSINWNVSEWANDGIDNDGDGFIDEGDETGIKLVALSVNYNDRGIAKTLTMNFFKHELL